MDLKNFKKVDEDDSHTTLRHYAGHELKVAHKKLSKSHREKLQALPLAKGGKVGKEATAKAEEDTSKIKSIKNNMQREFESQDRLEKERKIKPKLKGLAEGGPAHKYAEDDEADVPQALDPNYKDPLAVDTKDPLAVDISPEARAKAVENAPEKPTQSVSSYVPRGASMESDPGMIQSPKATINEANQDIAKSEAEDPSLKPPVEEPQQEAPQAAEAPQAQPMMQQPAAPKNVSDVISQPSSAQEADAAFQKDYNDAKQDYLNRDVKPKTYHDLYADKGTLGRLGMMFGLMISGGGSAVAGQPNMLMEMMNKEIDRDIEAQRKNQDKRQNWLSAMNTYHTSRMKNLETASNIDLNKANTELANTTNAKNKMLLNTVATFGEQVERIHDGPNKQPAIQALQTVSNGADQQAALNSAQTAQQIEENWKRHNMALSVFPETANLAATQAARHIPGTNQYAARDIPEGTRGKMLAMKVLDDKAKDVLSYIQKNKLTMNQEKRGIAAQKVEELKNFYNDSVGNGGALTQSRLEWYDKQLTDTPLGIVNTLLKTGTGKFEEVKGSNMTRLKSLYGSFGIDHTKLGLDSSSHELEGQTVVNKQTGERRVMRNGKWTKI